MSGQHPYNPLEKRHLAESVTKALLLRPAEPLESIGRFSGAGIYALYYTGDFDDYAPVAARNRMQKWEAPIYVGKAVPSGARKGGLGSEAVAAPVLWKRLAEHSDSIKAAPNLRIEDFACRYLCVDDIWIPLGEGLLIEAYRPLWNVVVEGFGNHDPGSGRYLGKMSHWDILHAGRSWAGRLQPGTPLADIRAKIQHHLQKLG